MAATAAALALYPENPTTLRIAAPLARYRGVKRRQEILHATPALTVIEDFGHHPTALAETLRSFRNRFPDATLTAVFEPRSNTARTRTHQEGFMRALALADEVYLGAVNRADRLKPEDRFDTIAVIRHLAAKGIAATTAPTNAALLEKLSTATLPPPATAPATAPAATVPGKPRVVVFFSNGSFDGIIANYAAAAATTAQARPTCIRECY
jgi:UDP-N-acetylmuramate: L-alanyl-gamma-D-glutamyl-meso-diaminopimelate ligase